MEKLAKEYSNRLYQMHKEFYEGKITRQAYPDPKLLDYPDWIAWAELRATEKINKLRNGPPQIAPSSMSVQNQ